MSEQKVYQKILRKVIDQTKHNQISTSEQLIHLLMHELISHDGLVKSYVQTKDEMYS